MKIEDVRAEIDRIDRNILDLLSRRANLAIEAGRLKSAAGVPIYDPIREEEVLSALAAAGKGPLPEAAIIHIFREIISASRSLEHTVRVTCQGSREGWATRAAARCFGSFVNLHSGDSPEVVVSGVQSGAYDYGVLIPFQDAETPYWPSLISLGESNLQLLCELPHDTTRTFLVGRENPEIGEGDWVAGFLKGVEPGEVEHACAEAGIDACWQQADVVWLETNLARWRGFQESLAASSPHLQARFVGRLGRPNS